MAARHSILANLSALATGQAAAMTLGLVMNAVLARAVGPESYGMLGFAGAVISYFGIAATLGTDMWATREIAAARENVRIIVGEIVTLRLALSVLAYALLIALVTLWGRPSTVDFVVLITGANLFVASITLDFAFQGIERMAAAARRQVIAAALSLAGVSAAIWLGYGIAGAAAALQTAAFVATLVMGWEFVRLAGWPSFGRTALGAAKHILREATPMAITGIIGAVYFSIDVIMLEFMRPEVEVGYYVAAGRILSVGMVGVGIFRTAFAPVLARLYAQPRERREAGSHHARALVSFGALVSLGGFLLAPEILTFVYGPSFIEAASVLQILMLNLLFAYPVEIYHTQFVAWRLQNQQMVIVIAGAVINVALNALLIPSWGMNAAAGNTLASTIAVLALSAFTMRRHGYETHLGAIGRTIMLTAILGEMGLIGLVYVEPWIDGTIPRLVVLGTAVTAIYCAFAWRLGVLRPQELLAYLARREEVGD